MSQVIEPTVQATHPALRQKYDCLIGGVLEGSESGNTFATTNPATGEKLAEVPDCDARDVDRAVRAAQKASREWRRMTPTERGGYCRRFAERLRARKDVYAALDALDGGNPVTQMRADVMGAAAQLEYFAGIASEIKGETVPSAPQTFNFTLREPYGVVAKIIPFNHPLMFAARIGSPLMAGNTVVLKPAEQTPLSALEMAHDVKEIFPPGVVNIITGDGPSVGAPLVRHPGVRRIAFTGSVEVGRAIMRDAAEGLKTISMELGGKNPMIVFPDVDVDQAVASAFNGMNYCVSQGQSCGSTSRLFLHTDIHDAFIERLANKMKSVRIGLPIDEKTEMGSLVSRDQFDKVMSYIEIGKKEGAVVMTGGGKPSDRELQQGYFVEPTLFTQVDYRMRLAQEEIFGPVESVIAWTDPKQLIPMANSVIYGLTASIWSRDFATAYRLASEIEAGYIWINESSKHFIGMPFGGYKLSGLGRQECLADLLSYTQQKSVNVNLL